VPRRAPKLPDRELTAAEYNDAVMAAMNEAEFQRWVIGTAAGYGWQREFIYHTRIPIGSEPGFPDLVLVRDRVIYWELKSETGVEKPKQQRLPVWRSGREYGSNPQARCAESS